MEAHLFTKKLTNADSPFEIKEEYGVTNYSILLKNGAATIIGDKKLGGMSPDAIDLVEGTPFNGSNGNGVCCLIITIAGGGEVDFAAQ